MKELIFHIGTPKTASSALQVFLARNRENLLGRGVDYLPIGEFQHGLAGKITSGNGVFVARGVLPVGVPVRLADPEPQFRALFKAVNASSADKGIVSSELFSPADHRLFSQLIVRLQTAGLTVKCLYFIRSQVQSLCSDYMQRVKRHGLTEYPAPFVQGIYKKITHLKSETFHKSICGLFSPQNVMCRTYEDASVDEKGVFGAFLSALGADTDGLDYGTPDINTSLPPRQVAIMLLLNRFAPRMAFSDYVVENAIQTGSAASGQIHNLLPPDLISEIEHYFAEGNAWLARQYFNREELFPRSESQGDQEPVSLEGVTTEDIISFFGGLTVRFDERIGRLEALLAKNAGNIRGPG